MYIGRERVLEKRNEYLIPCTNYFYKQPPQIVKGEMQFLFDEKGKRYLDFFSGVSVMNCGHCNPFILERVIEQMKTLQHVTNLYLTQPIVDLAEKLAKVLPGDINSSFFCMSGSEANEGALMLARLHTGKEKFVALSHSLHGRTNLTMSTTAIPMWRTDATLYEGVHIIPNVLSCENIEDGARLSIQNLKEVLAKDGQNIAAFIAEPIQGNGGIVVPPTWYFSEIKKLLEQHNVLMIIDEIQTGFARTGKMFAIENFNVVPDIITMAKALGNGVPIAAFSTTKKIAKALSKPSASTLGGNPVSCASAMAVLDFIEENNLCIRAQKLGELLMQKLNVLKQKHSIIKCVRGIGLMQGIELVNSKGEAMTTETDLILEHLLNVGIIIGKNGLARNVLALQPPLIIDERDIDFLVSELDKALSLYSFV